MNNFTFGFIIAIISYLIFSVVEYLYPGFVVNSFSLQWFWIFIIGFGLISILKDQKKDYSNIVSIVVSSFLSASIFFLVWSESGVFNDFRLPLSIAGASIIWIVRSAFIKNRI